MLVVGQSKLKHWLVSYCSGLGVGSCWMSWASWDRRCFQWECGSSCCCLDLDWLDSFLWLFDFGLDLIAMETLFLPLSLPLYFSVLGVGRYCLLVGSIPSLFQVLDDYELTTGDQVDWLDSKEARQGSWQYSKGFLPWLGHFRVADLAQTEFTLSRGGLLLVTYSWLVLTCFTSTTEDYTADCKFT